MDEDADADNDTAEPAGRSLNNAGLYHRARHYALPLCCSDDCPLGATTELMLLLLLHRLRFTNWGRRAVLWYRAWILNECTLGPGWSSSVQPRRRPNRKPREPPWAPAEISVLACSHSRRAPSCSCSRPDPPLRSRSSAQRAIFISRADCGSSQACAPSTRGCVPLPRRLHVR